MNADKAERGRGCPDRASLASFTRGELSWEERESIAEHLSACKACEASVQDLQSQETIVAHLRRQPEPPSMLAEPECRRLEERARQIPYEVTNTPTVSLEAEEELSAGGPRLPASFGVYVLVERLGQGGMGIVYKARQEPLKRFVAVKMVRAGVYASTEERARFRREGESIARIRHANVVQIHEFGEQEGQAFFSMELVEGGNLAGKLSGRPMPEREAAELVRTLAHAVHAAHMNGIVHRDLKPSNVLLGADGTPKITDFGLAKLLDGQGDETRSDTILGTPAYMAPEQARGESRKIGPAADVYALGAILYETLTGRPPFKAETRQETMELVRGHDPAPPSRARPGLARDLEAICLKCLEKEPARRFDSAAALAEELERWLRGEPSLTRPEGKLKRFWRRVRRHPGLATAIALLLLLSVALPVTWWYRNPERPIRAIEDELARGRPQTLIGEMGRPAWFRWCMGEETSTASSLSDEAFSVHSSNLALVELVRDPRRQHFRLRAEVRHERIMEFGEVGIYVAHQLYFKPRGSVHYLIQLTYDDINEPMKIPRAKPLPPNIILPQRKESPVHLCPHLFWEESRWSDWDYRLSGSAPRLFEPAGFGEKPWRSLTLEVTPNGVEGSWGETAVGHLPALELGQGTRKSLDQRRKDQPQELRFQGFEPDFVPRGALGLLVFRASASFRQVVIEPLD